MDFQKVTQYFSQHRFASYFAASNSDFDRAIAVYKNNLQIAASFHPLLGVLEVALRNSINQLLTSYFNDADWITNQKTGFMSHPSLTQIDRRTGITTTNNFLKAAIDAAEKRFRRLGIPITTGKIISEQNLSFWTDLFEVHHYRLLQGRPIQIFQHLPSGRGRRQASGALTKIRQFRNRINHNKPICFIGTRLCFAYVEDVYQTIIAVLNWLDPDLRTWTSDFDTIKQTIADGKSI